MMRYEPSLITIAVSEVPDGSGTTTLWSMTKSSGRWPWCPAGSQSRPCRGRRKPPCNNHSCCPAGWPLLRDGRSLPAGTVWTGRIRHRPGPCRSPRSCQGAEREPPMSRGTFRFIPALETAPRSLDRRILPRPHRARRSKERFCDAGRKHVAARTRRGVSAARRRNRARIRWPKPANPTKYVIICRVVPTVTPSVPVGMRPVRTQPLNSSLRSTYRGPPGPILHRRSAVAINRASDRLHHLRVRAVHMSADPRRDEPASARAASRTRSGRRGAALARCRRRSRARQPG